MRALALLLALTWSPAAAEEIGAGPHPLDGSIWDVAAGERIDRETLAARLGGADVAVLGEVHDNPAHHLAQAWLVGCGPPAWPSR